MKAEQAGSKLEIFALVHKIAQHIGGAHATLIGAVFADKHIEVGRHYYPYFAKGNTGAEV